MKPWKSHITLRVDVDVHIYNSTISCFNMLQQQKITFFFNSLYSIGTPAEYKQPLANIRKHLGNDVYAVDAPPPHTRLSLCDHKVEILSKHSNSLSALVSAQLVRHRLGESSHWHAAAVSFLTCGGNDRQLAALSINRQVDSSTKC